jgi:hypothetical protein
VQVDRFAVEKMPVMLIYNKFQSWHVNMKN